MLLHVLALAQDSQVLRTVVALIAVNVVDDLSWKKRPADDTLRDHAMLMPPPFLDVPVRGAFPALRVTAGRGAIP